MSVVGTFGTCRRWSRMSVVEGGTDLAQTRADFR
jgi:hypothetical protein